MKKQRCFFQIIHPLIIQNQELEIPRRFVRKYGKDLSDVAVLEVPNGKVWNVGLKRSGDSEISFKNSWHDFVAYHSISNGHFLVFRYHKNSVFHVRIYNITGCEIQYVSDNTEECRARTGVGEKTRECKKDACYIGKQKEVISLDADSSSDEPNSLSQQSLSWNGGNKDVEDPTKNTDASDHPNSFRSESRRDIQCSALKGKEVEEETSLGILYTKTVNNPPVLRRSLGCSVARRNKNERNGVEGTTTKVEQDKSEKISLNPGNQTEVVATDVSESSSNQSITSSSQPVSQGNRRLGTNGSGKSKQEEVGMSASKTRPPPRRGATRREDRERAIHAARQFKSENPFCVVNVRPSYVNGPWMYLPYKFMERYAKKIDYLTLVVPNGGSEKVWHCHLLWYNHKPTVMIYDGWKVFVAETNLKDGDVCVFELINTEHNVFNVSIFRG